MPTQLIPQKLSVMREWELAGLSLSSTLDKYLDLSERLGVKALVEKTRPQDLANRIDLVLESLHTDLNRKLSLVQSTLARTRNQLMSSAYCLPNEILTKIFMDVVYSPINQQPVQMQTDMRYMFRNLYSLQLVCGTWREIILSHGSFWRFIPIYYIGVPGLHNAQPANLISKRSKGDLYLAAPIRLIPSVMNCPFPFSPRFRRINLSSNRSSVISDFLARLVRCGPSFHPSELSLYDSSNRFSGTRDVAKIMSQESANWDSFCELLKSLSVFRVRGTHFDWDHIGFSGSLVKAHIQNVIMGSDTTEFTGFLRKLATAPNLRDLKFISVCSFSDDDSFAIVPPKDKIHFPSLEYLLLEDLPGNTLITAILYITSESHCLTVHLTKKCTQIVGDELQAPLDLDDVFNYMSRVPADMLILSGGDKWEPAWVPDDNLYILLGSQSRIKSLKLSHWSLDEPQCRLIAEPQISKPEATLFPSLTSLDLSSVRIWDGEWLKRIVTNHPIEQMALGGYLRKGTNEPPEFEPIRGDEPIVDWLRLNVPDFTLRNESALPPEYLSSVWQLW